MNEPRNSTKRYMDFVGPRRSSATDPLISRPVARNFSLVPDDPLAAKTTKNANVITTQKSTALGSPRAAQSKSLTRSPKSSTPAPASEPIFPSTATPRTRHLSRAPVRPVSASRPVSALAASPARHVPSNLKFAQKSPVPAQKPPVPIKSSSETKIAVKQTEEKALISRKPSTAPKEYFPTLLEDEFSHLQIKTTDHPHDDVAKKASSALSGTSPFLSNYNIDKRPLSNSIPEKKTGPAFEKLSYLGVNDPATASDSPRRKKLTEEEAENELIEPKGKKLEKIIEKSPTSVIPTVLIILLTIIFGAAAGAGVYFLLPK